MPVTSSMASDKNIILKNSIELSRTDLDEHQLDENINYKLAIAGDHVEGTRPFILCLLVDQFCDFSPR